MYAKKVVHSAREPSFPRKSPQKCIHSSKLEYKTSAIVENVTQKLQWNFERIKTQRRRA